MPDFRAKMHQKSISPGAPPQTPLGSLALPRPPSWIWGPSSKGRGGKGKGGEGKEGGRKRKGEDDCYSKLF